MPRLLGLLLLASLIGLVWLGERVIAQSSTTIPTASATAKAPEADADARSSPSFLEILFSGGVTGVILMLMLIACSIAALALMIEHSLTIREQILIPAGLADRVRDQLAAGNVVAADQVCQTKPSLLAFILRAGLAEADGGWPAVEKAMEDATAEQSARYARKIEYLAVLGNIGPMLGLLGTVVGMVWAFREVAESQGAARAADLAQGIYQALVTTVVGLLIAIPALGAFAIFRNRVDHLVTEAAYQAQHAMTPLKRGGRARRPATPPAPPAAPSTGAT